MHYKHIDGVTVTAQFAEENGLRYRYRLEIKLQAPSVAEKTACVVMQNPSYAGKNEADKSVQFMEKVVFQKGQTARVSGCSPLNCRESVRQNPNESIPRTATRNWRK